VTDLRIAVVGLGARGYLADYAHRPEHGSRVVAVVDPRPAATLEAVRRFGSGVVAFTDHRDLAGVDAALVLAPDHHHEEIAVDLLRAGIATFVEKPLAITTRGCDRILATAREHATRLYVGHNLRHAPFVRAMRGLVLAGAVGEVKAVWCRHFVGHGGDFYFTDWHADRRNTTGLLLQKGAHDIDVIHWLAGGRTIRAQAFGDLAVHGTNPRRAPVVDVEDLSLVNLRLDNGVLAAYQQCHFTPDYWRNYTVIGTGGRLENFGDLDGGEIRLWNRRRAGYPADADLVVPVPAEDGTHGGADAAVVAEFLAYARAGGRTVTSPVAARDAVAAGCAATESLRAGGVPVDVAPLAPPLAAYFTGEAERPGSRR
jgi:predicted dehydrogenase